MSLTWPWWEVGPVVVVTHLVTFRPMVSRDDSPTRNAKMARDLSRGHVLTIVGKNEVIVNGCRRPL